jgi:hypothetical protein
VAQRVRLSNITQAGGPVAPIPVPPREAMVGDDSCVDRGTSLDDVGLVVVPPFGGRILHHGLLRRVPVKVAVRFA